MGENNLYFGTGDKVRIEQEQYDVQGLISFYNDADDYRWTEYKLKAISSGVIRWLSIDTTYNEYAIYDQYRYSKEFKDDEIIAKGYKQADYGTATVSAFRGDVDVDTGDIVRFKEFEDSTEEKIMAIEVWEDETEYSKGYYLDEDEIEKVSDNAGSYDNSDYSQSKVINEGHYEGGSGNGKTVAIILVALIVLIPILVIVIKGIGGSKTVSMSQFISSDSNFIYTTSITSDTDSNEKADIYSTTLDVESAAKAIIDGINGETEDVQENSEDNSVGILTAEEYCLVYISETGETLVQISTRLYTYSSNNTPYRSHYNTGIYYRSYYYTRGYTSDTNRYSGYQSGYQNYNDGTVNTNSNNKYQSYSSSVRQSSAGSRTSSGGGTSSGK